MFKLGLKTAVLGLIFALGLPLVAEAGCIKTRTQKVTANVQNGYGSLGGYPKLFLRPGEYVITFDDGPNPVTTPQILKILDSYCVKSTFFMMGNAAEKAPDIVRTVAQKGHTVASHTYSHPNLTTMPFSEAKAQIDNGRAYVGRALNPVATSGYPTLFRFPNNVSTKQLDTYLASQKVIAISYDITPMDWKNEDANVEWARLQTLLNQNDRGIIVLHDIMPNTVKLLPMLMKWMQDKHYIAVQLVP